MAEPGAEFVAQSQALGYFLTLIFLIIITYIAVRYLKKRGLPLFFKPLKEMVEWKAWILVIALLIVFFIVVYFGVPFLKGLMEYIETQMIKPT